MSIIYHFNILLPDLFPDTTLSPNAEPIVWQ